MAVWPVTIENLPFVAEQATDPMLNSENWALNMEICDL